VIGILERKFIERGAKLFGFTPTDNLHHRRPCLIGGIIRADVISYLLIISAAIELLQMSEHGHDECHYPSQQQEHKIPPRIFQ
jgi:hypothetical protein